MANLRFISASIDKIQEYTELLKPLVFTPLQLTLQEFFGDEIREVVRQKVLRAYKMKRAPLFVEHTGIFIDAVGGMPGPFTSLFWQHMQAQGLLRLVQCERDRRATLKTVIGYCDGRRIHYFEGQLQGTIAPEPAGDLATGMCLFVPEGFCHTMAEMTLEQRNAISQRKQAAEQLQQFLLEAGEDLHGRIL